MGEEEDLEGSFSETNSLSSFNSGSVSSFNESSTSTGGSGGNKIKIEKYDTKEEILQTVPQVKISHELQAQEMALWESLVKELTVNPVVMAGVVRAVMQWGTKHDEELDAMEFNPMDFDEDSDSCYDKTHSTFFVHLGQFFFDSLLSDDRLNYKESSLFLKFFREFCRESI
jgi:hypothetical protein